MLEPVARCGGARIVAWTRGDTTVHTPLVLARATHASGHGNGVLVGARDAVPARAGPIVQSIGGFHAETTAADPAVWSQIVVSRARRITGQLSLRRRMARPTGQLGDDEEPDDPTSTTRTDLPVGPVSDDPENGGGELAVFAEAASSALDPAHLAPRLVEARERAGPARLLYAPGIGLVHHVALLTYAGVDVLDTLAVERATHDGQYLTAEGAFRAADLAVPLDGHGPDTPPRSWDHATLLAHNLTAFDAERRTVAGHIHNGTLRELIEQRARAHPATTALLRHLDAQREHFAGAWPLVGKGRVLATTMESLHRPDVTRYRDRIRNDYQPPAAADVLVLLPCSASKPYQRSKSHGVFRRVIGELQKAALVHEVIVTSPLGVVPRELEHTWPAAHYDVPVTGHWDAEERLMIRTQVKALLDKGHHRHVISHLGPGTHALIADLLPTDAVHTGTPHPTAYSARDALRAAIKDATAGTNAPAWPKRRLADAHAIATWQFGRAGADALVPVDGDTSGRPPMLRVYAERGKSGNLATFVPERGLFSLTLAGMQRLFDAGVAKCVEIDDFVPRGTVFAVGVKSADPAIIPGDEVALVHDGQLRGVGPALATGPEMTAFGRGPAVEVRHHA